MAYDPATYDANQAVSVAAAAMRNGLQLLMRLRDEGMDAPEAAALRGSILTYLDQITTVIQALASPADGPGTRQVLMAHSRLWPDPTAMEETSAAELAGHLMTQLGGIQTVFFGTEQDPGFWPLYIEKANEGLFATNRLPSGTGTDFTMGETQTAANMIQLELTEGGKLDAVIEAWASAIGVPF